MNHKEKPKKNQCPTDEVIASYIDGLLSSQERNVIDQHITLCKSCKEIFSIQAEIANFQKEEGLGFVPDYVTAEAKGLMDEKYGVKVLKLVANFSDKVFETIRTTGEIISGYQLQPAFALRDSTSADQVKTLGVRKIFDNIRVEIEITRESGALNTIILRIKDNHSEVPIDNLRATLIQDKIELESYITQNGKAIFETIKSGQYLIEISKVDSIVGAITLELNKE